MPAIGDFLTNADNLAELGSRLRARRLDRNMTTQALAEKTGLNRKTIMDLEAGRDVRLSTVIKVFRSLNLLGALNAMIPDALPMNEALTTRGLPRERAYRSAVKKS